MCLFYLKLKQFCTSLRICENQKNKILSLNLSKSRIFKTNCLCTIKNFMIMLRFFKQKAFCGCKSQIFVFGYWIAGCGDRAGYPVRRRMRLGDDFHWLGVSLEVILRIRRLRRSVCGAHGCSAPPPSSAWVLTDYISFTFSYKLRYFT